MKRVIKRTLLVVAAILAPILLVVIAFIARFIPFLPVADYPEPASQAEARLQDLDFLRRYPDYDWTFTDEQRVAFLAEIDEIATQAGELSDAQFELAVARAVALADNGHTNISPISRRARVNALPLRLAWFSDGLYVLHATRENQDLLGARIELVAGLSPDQLADLFTPYSGGELSRSRYISVLNMESPELLHALGVSPDPDSVVVSVMTADGREITRELQALPPFTDRSMRRWGGQIKEYELAPEAGDWVHLMAGQTPPLYLASPDKPFEMTRLEAAGGLYLKLDMTMDIDGFILVDFQQSVLDEMDRRSPNFVVVDLRHNGGGTIDEWFSESVAERLPDDGHIFIVTSPETFSGGISEAAYFKYFGGDRSLVVGEPVGDRLIFWANGGDVFRLPNSGIPMNVWVSKEDWENGCDDWWLCFWPTMLTDVGVGTLEPDIPVSVSFTDYVVGRDPVMVAILATIGN